MGYGKNTVYLFTVLFAAVALFFWQEEPEPEPGTPIVVSVASQGREEEIQYWESGDGMYYFFLPSYADPAASRIQNRYAAAVWIGDVLLTENTTVADIPLNTPCILTYQSGEDTVQRSITFMQSANVPAMYIDVSSGNMNYIHEAKGNEETGNARIYTADGVLQHEGNLEFVKGRGNYTWWFEKKSYSLKLSREDNLLGMGAAEKWILLANAADPLQIRNKISYDFASEIGAPFSPACAWVDLYLNGEYAGLYLLCERNEIHPQRVDIDPGSSFLVSIELESRLTWQDYPYIRTENGTAFRIHQKSISESRIQEIWKSAETAIFSGEGTDPQTGKHWTELIDLDSWTRKYLMDEVFGNYDGGAISQFFYYQESDGRIYAGPVWDMDNSLAASEWVDAPNAILAGRQYIWSEEDTPLFYALLQKPEFQERVVTLYREEFLPRLTELCRTGLEQHTEPIAQPAAMNQIRWNQIAETLDSKKLQSYLEQRMAFLQKYWIEQGAFFTVQAFLPTMIWGSWAIEPGDNLEKCLPDEEYVWYDRQTNEPIDLSAPVYESRMIYGKHISEIETG